MMMTDSRLLDVVAHQPYPLLFATISGAHLYGFPSPDSDYDVRGVHILPAQEVLGLGPGRETIERSEVHEGLELDLVTHDVRKFFLLLLKKNGYVLEQLFSPLVLLSTPEHEQLQGIAKQCITRHHSHHYSGFARTQWKLFDKERPRRVKPLLYVYRVLLTGIHLMRTGRVEANLRHLSEEYRLPYIGDLVARKLAGPEASALDDADIAFYEQEYERLLRELEQAHLRSSLPEAPAGQPALNELLVRLRLVSVPTHGTTYFQMACTAEIDIVAGTTCPVCGCDEAFVEPGAYDICPRCDWEDDPVQRSNPDFPGGANRMSLKEARNAWRAGRQVL
jgi:uncharacterized protein